jgi:hypothetical protein
MLSITGCTHKQFFSLQGLQFPSVQDEGAPHHLHSRVVHLMADVLYVLLHKPMSKNITKK